MIHRFSPKIHLHNGENQHVMENNYPKRSRSRTKSSSLDVCSLQTPIFQRNENIRFVRLRLVFLHIGDIDTLNEKYHADIYFEARWNKTINVNILESSSDDQSKLSSDDQSKLLNEYLPVRIKDTHAILDWKPELFVENGIGNNYEKEKWFTIKRCSKNRFEPMSPALINIEICEHRRLTGFFWEKLELNHFPADVQDLSVSITTQHHINSCVLTPDEDYPSTINREAFFDQQEWKLYEHVATETRETTEEYSFEDQTSGIQQKHHSVLTVTCRAARRPGYYYWNGFCLIFLITICAFCIFSIPPNLPQSRLQITCTLLLTSVTFRWVVNRSLPTISYLTTLDKYAIISIIILVVLCIWHSVIAAVIFFNPDIASPTQVFLHTNIYAYVDRYVFICMFIIYILIHILLIIWLIFVPYKRRRDMENLDRTYTERKLTQLDTRRIQYKSQPSHQSQDISIQGKLDRLPTPVRNGGTIIPNATTILSIKEETPSQTHDSIEINGQDDVFYDHTNDEPKTTENQPINNL